MALTLVLSVGKDSWLAGNRNLVLRSAGYQVVSAFSAKEAVERFLAGDFDLVVIWDSISRKGTDLLTSAIRSSGSLTPILSVAANDDQQNSAAGSTLQNRRDQFLTGISQMLAQAQNRAAAFTRRRELRVQ